jgi:PTS system nitrogen regulatory IIA component
MQIQDLLSPRRVRYCQQVTSKKRVLERISELLADTAPDLTSEEVFNCLIDRERLGSTGLGKGVAIPHGRVSGLREPVGAFIRLDEGIDFDAIDGLPVDLLFALLVPSESTKEHLGLLAQLAGMFASNPFCTRLRESRSDDELYNLINRWEPSRETA